MPGCSAIFSSLCRGRAPLPEDEPERVESKRNRKPFETCLIDGESKTIRIQTLSTEAQDVIALLQLQRELGAIHGTWLSRARIVMATVASAFDAAEVRLYGAVRADKDGPPTSFVLLMSSYDPACPINPEAEPTSLPVAGQEIMPEPGGEPDTMNDERLHRLLAPLVVARAGGTPRQQLLDMMPHMLDRLIATQAPVVRASSPAPLGLRTTTCRTQSQDLSVSVSKSNGKDRMPPANYHLNSSSTDRTGDPTSALNANTANMGAVVPLSSGDRIYAVLWIAVYDNPITNGPAARTSQPAPVASAPSQAASMAPASTSAVAGLRLQDTVALQQLGLSLSMCLLGPDLSYLIALSDCIHQISAATCMQAFLAGLCDGMTQFVRLRFLLEPRVIPALVPDPSSPVGLMISWTNERTQGAAGSLSRTNTNLNPKMSRCYATTPQQSVFSLGIGDMRSEGIDGSIGAHHVPRLVAGPVATLLGKQVGQLLTRAHSDINAHSVGRQQAAAAAGLDGSIGASGGGLRPVRVPSVQRVIPLLNTDLLGTSPSELATGSAAVNMAAAAAALASGAGGGVTTTPALRVKPFPMAHTLLRHMIRKAGGGRGSTNQGAGGPAAAAGAVTQGGSGGTPLAQPLAQPTHFIPSPYGMEVEDCTGHVQDAKRPSRDILLLLATMSMGFSVAASTPDRAAAAVAAEGGVGGSGGSPMAAAAHAAPVLPSRSGGSFSSGRRSVRSLLLLALPTDEGKGVLGMYVTFAQRLPVQLLSEARSSLMDLLEVAGPLITYKLRKDLALELGTLSSATPGSYAVVEGPELEAPSHDASGNVAAAVRRTCDLPCCASDIRLSSTPNALYPDDQPGTQLAGAERILPMFSTLAPYAFCDPRQLAGHGSCALAAGGGAGAGGSGAIAHMNSMNLMDTFTGGVPEGGGGMTCLLSGRYSAVAHSNNHALNMAQDAYSTSVIHVEELDTVNNSMRAQMPLLVASLQNSISTVRVEATVAAMAAASSQRPNGTLNGAIASLLPSAAPEMGDLAQLELQSQLGHGGCAVVFKGTLGVWDCAVKLMEMPEVDEVDSLQSTPTKAGGNGGAGGGTSPQHDGGGADGGGGGHDDDYEHGEQHVAARRALLRNAMELAAMTTISHPNIMQVYSNFSNVTLGRRVMPDRSERFIIKPADTNNSPDAPICVAIVCEWCDKGCLGSALYKRTFPTVVAASSVNSGGSGSRLNTPGSRARMLDFRGIYMTLLDVAMALRHLHAHNLIHRDLKPANVLLKTNSMDPRGFTAKLADFGFVTLLNQEGDEANGGEPFAVVDETCGTVTHMPPESWKKPARLDASYDVYSFGILMWELTAGAVRPYPDVHPKNIPRMVRRGVRPTFEDSIPPQYRMLAQRCWAADPSQRPRTTEVVSLINQHLGRM